MGDQIISLFMHFFPPLLFKIPIFSVSLTIENGGEARAAEGSLGKTDQMKLDCEGEEGKVETPFEVENP